MSSSVTDTEAYRAVCLAAATDDQAFATFRTDPVYAPVVQIAREQGEWCREHADPDIMALVPDPNDWTFCRYAWQLTRIESLFGRFKGADVLEIGGGFGGMALLMMRRNDAPRLRSYTIVDLPEVQQLQRRYLGPLASAVRFVPAERPMVPFRSSHFLLSNWAFSELKPAWQRLYADRYLRHAESGYMECNFVQDCLGADDVQALVPGSRWIEDIPPTHPLNRVLVWGDR